MPEALHAPFDAVLLISFGGPLGPADISPFLRNVLRGRRIPPDRIEAVVHHYELFDGVSPITDLTFRQARGLEARLAERGLPLPVHVGMRNWHPFLDDALRALGAAGHRRVVGFPTAAYRCYSSCGQYKQNVLQAREVLRAEGAPDVEVTFVGDWFEHPRYLEAVAARVADAAATLAPAERARARLIFTAHSIPMLTDEWERYERQLRTSARLAAGHLGWDDWALVYQSRSGRPEDPWLEPDINDYLRDAHRGGLAAAVVCPIGFISDHIEVLFDLDVEAAQTARDLGLAFARAASVNDHPLFIDAMADIVEATWTRYARGRPIPLVDATHPNAREAAPVAR